MERSCPGETIKAPATVNPLYHTFMKKNTIETRKLRAVIEETAEVHSPST